MSDVTLDHATRIGFIGGGNMAHAMIAGLIKRGVAPGAIQVSDPSEAALTRLRALSGGLGLATDTNGLLTSVDACVLAVKPQILRRVVSELDIAGIERMPLMISIAAGVRATDIERWLGPDAAVVRAMPNQPALLGLGVSGAYAGASVTRHQRSLATDILRAAGDVCWVTDEHAMDSVTAVSGSGPAYFFLLIEAMQDAAVSLGLTEAQAQRLVVQTAIGAAAMASADDADIRALRAGVTSPGGTTDAAISHLLAHDLPNLYHEALDAARNRAVELADQAAED